MESKCPDKTLCRCCMNLNLFILRMFEDTFWLNVIQMIFIYITEQMLRDEGKPLFGSLAARQTDCLRALIKFAIMSSQSQFAKPEVIKEHCIKQLACKLQKASFILY